MSKLISTFQIRFDDETKAEIAALKGKLDAITGTLGVSSALLGNIKPIGGLLAAMAGEAANDTPEPDLKQMGQWVFEGQDEEWISAHVDSTGFGYHCRLKKSELVAKEKHWGNRWGDVGYYTKPIGPIFDTTNWENSAIDREVINDVDYLSETVSEIQGMDAREIIIDDLWPDQPMPQITQADMQLIFIKNLSECLIQRMHSMDRFSHDDYTIGGLGGDVMMTWDIVYDRGADRFGIITAAEKEHYSAVFFKPLSITVDTPAAFHKYSLLSNALRTITEDEIPNFRGVMEAWYA